MELYNINVIYIGIIIFILFKSFTYHKKKIRKHENPTLEYYEWKRLFFKMLVLHEIKKKIKHKHIKRHFDKQKWRDSIINKSAFF